MDLDIVESFPPQLDNSPQKERSELAQKGSLGHRRPPTRAGIRAFVSSVWDDDSSKVHSSTPPDSPIASESPPPPLLHQNGKESDEEVHTTPSSPIRGWKRPPKHAVLVFPMQLLSNNNKLKEDARNDSTDDVKCHNAINAEEEMKVPDSAIKGPTIVSITLKTPDKNVINIGGPEGPTQVLIRPYGSTAVGKRDADIPEDRNHCNRWERSNTSAGTHSTVVFLNRENSPSRRSPSRGEEPSEPSPERLARRDGGRVHIQTWDRRRASPSTSPSPSRARLRDLVTRPASVTGDEGGRRDTSQPPSSRRSSPGGHRYVRPEGAAKPEWLRKIDLERRRGIDWENLEKQQKASSGSGSPPVTRRPEHRERSSSDSFILDRESLVRRSDGCRRWTPPSEPEWIQIARRRRQNRINWESINERQRRSPPPLTRNKAGVVEDVGVQVNLKKETNKSSNIIQNILSKVRAASHRDEDVRDLPLVITTSTPSGVSRSPERSWRRKKETSPVKWTEREVLIEDLPKTRETSPSRHGKGTQPSKLRQPLRVRSPSPPRRRYEPSSSCSSDSESEHGGVAQETPSKKKVRFMISAEKKNLPASSYTLFGMEPPPPGRASSNKENVPVVRGESRLRKPSDKKVYLFSGGGASPKAEEAEDYQLQAYRIIRQIKQYTKDKEAGSSPNGRHDNSVAGHHEEGLGSQDSSPPEPSGRRTPEWMKRVKQKPTVNWESLGEERSSSNHESRTSRPPAWAQFQLKKTPFSNKYLQHRQQGGREDHDDEPSTDWNAQARQPAEGGAVKRSEPNSVIDSEGYSSMESSGGPACAYCGRPQEEWPAPCSGACRPPVVVDAVTKNFKRGPQTKTVRKTLRRILRGSPENVAPQHEGEEEIVEEITEEVFDLPSKTKTKKHIIRTVQQTKDGHRFLSTTIADGHHPDPS